jgi:hypothetical protein
MVCLELEIAFPIPPRYASEQTYLQRIDHLRKHYNADFIAKHYKGDFVHALFAVCDEEAAGFLRDLPAPTFCVKISYLRNDTVLYTNYKYTGLYTPAPKILILKKIYWLASSLEKWQPKFPQSFQKLGI